MERDRSQPLSLKQSARFVDCEISTLIAMVKSRFLYFPIPLNDNWASLPPEEWQFAKNELKLWERSARRKCVAILQKWYYERSADE